MKSLSASLYIILSLFAFTVTSAAILQKRGRWNVGNSGIYFDIGWEEISAWAGAIAAVCKEGNVYTCVGAAIVATIGLVLATGSNDGNNSGSEAANTNMKRMFGNTVCNNSQSFEYAHSAFQNTGIQLLGVYDISSNILNKRDNSSSIGDNPVILHFSTDLGTHYATHMFNNSIEAITNEVLTAIPGQLKEEDALKKRCCGLGTDGFEPTWVSYNFDNVNHDLTRLMHTLWPQVHHDEWADGIDSGLINHRGWKYCAALAVKGDDSDADLESGATGTAIHGELYFNTYGGIDSECNNVLDN